MLNANLSEVTQLEMYGAGRFKWMASEPLLLTPMQYWIWLYDQCEYMYVGVCLNLSIYLSIYLSNGALRGIPQSLEEEGIFTFYTYISGFTLTYIVSKIKNMIKKLNSNT